jgi:hypothetical protein
VKNSLRVEKKSAFELCKALLSSLTFYCQQESKKFAQLSRKEERKVIENIFISLIIKEEKLFVNK